MALDGSCMDVADVQANAEFFGYPGACGQTAFPQARVLGLVECGTHAVVAADIAPYGHSEQAMAAQLLPAKLTTDMLVLAGRNFYGFKLWQTACATGAKLAWRLTRVRHEAPVFGPKSALYPNQTNSLPAESLKFL